MRHGYVYQLEQEVTRLHRRRMWPVWLFAACFGALGLVAWLHHQYPQAPTPFVTEAK